MRGPLRGFLQAGFSLSVSGVASRVLVALSCRFAGFIVRQVVCSAVCWVITGLFRGGRDHNEATSCVAMLELREVQGWRWMLGWSQAQPAGPFEWVFLWSFFDLDMLDWGFLALSPILYFYPLSNYNKFLCIMNLDFYCLRRSISGGSPLPLRI
ncbi:hypothetical protein RchiOBHm_Chr7g0232351 [Rosa chinensis]|uniref:Uncharacterized protein n=1 Tax=Rosa chinensis TaxID=74649 RepID=A0A2P6PFW4_ROSCH|nr:hypothetical protein RchiOBHm_Chr7g0232351 [Rosa chinensis]